MLAPLMGGGDTVQPVRTTTPLTTTHHAHTQTPTPHTDVDPVIFQTYKTFWALLVSLITFTYNEFNWTPWGIVSGCVNYTTLTHSFTLPLSFTHT